VCIVSIIRPTANSHARFAHAIPRAVDRLSALRRLRPGAWRACRLAGFEGRCGPIWHAWFAGGWAGVDLFFGLSGFLIGGIPFSELSARARSASAGFIRRGWKIYPPFYAMIAFVIFFTAWHQIKPFSWYDGFRKFSLQNYCATCACKPGHWQSRSISI
jgi:peptidoglycan/LPS O-acetylase OafA/YrhL